MKKQFVIASMLCLLVACWAVPAMGQAVFVNVDEIQGLTPDGAIPEGGDLVIPVRITNNDVARTAISNGFDFMGGITYTSISAEWNPAYPWDWPHAVALGIFPPYFDMGIFTNYFNSPYDPDPDIDGVGFAGLTGAAGTGLPAVFDDVTWFITLTDLSGLPGEILVMDTTWWPPANYWLWSGIFYNVSWGGPYVFSTCCPPPPCPEGPYTECWPQPTVLKALENDRILEFYVFCEDNDDVILSSIRVGNIPPYTAAEVRGDTLYTDAFIMRFLGASGFRPVPPEGIQSSYTITYDKIDGSHVSLVGDYILAVYQGDVNFDTNVDLQDIVLLNQYLFEDSGKKAMLFGEEMDEFMDVDASGRFDILDVQALIQIVGI